MNRYINGLKLFKENSMNIEINNHSVKIHPRINIYCDITGYCNGNCGFCIAKVNYERNDNEKYIDTFRETLEITKHLNPSIQITGGEPTIDNKFGEIANILKEKNIWKTVLNTNGSGVLKNKDAVDIFDHIDTSRHHYNENINQEIMQLNPFLSNEKIKEIAKEYQEKIRLQCNLIKGYIDSFEEMVHFIEWARSIDVQYVSISGLTPLPKKEIYKKEIIDYVINRRVNIIKIHKKIEKDRRFKLIKQIDGVACYIDIYEYKDVIIVFKVSDNKYLHLIDRLKKWENYIADMILHTDGTLSGSWDKKCKQFR